MTSICCYMILKSNLLTCWVFGATSYWPIDENKCPGCTWPGFMELGTFLCITMPLVTLTQSKMNQFK